MSIETHVGEIIERGALPLTLGGDHAITALRLGRFFGTGPVLWMNLQKAYDLDKAKAQAFEKPNNGNHQGKQNDSPTHPKIWL